MPIPTRYRIMAGKIMRVMKRKNHILFAAVCIAFMAASCTEADVNVPRGSTAVPGKVTVTEIVNGSGYSVIHYRLPDDNNLQYVKAVYTPRPDVQSEVNASFMTDSLGLTGFKEAGDHKVELYSVSYGGTVSDPVQATVSPETPPYRLTAENLDMQATFGGVGISTENPTRSNLVLTLMRQEEDGSWSEVSTNYTSRAQISYSVRGMESVPQTFRMTVKDRWGSASESSEFTVTPLYESMCDKSLFAELRLAGDTNENHVTGSISSIWDNAWPTSSSASAAAFHTKPNTPIPQHVSFDMGAVYDLSRLVFHPRQLFINGHPRTFEVYGAVELNPDADAELFDADGNLDPYWYLLGFFESTRPSGNTVPASQVANTTEDLEVMQTGQEFEFPLNTREARYIRFRTMSTWGNVTYVEIPEIDFFGALHAEGE